MHGLLKATLWHAATIVAQSLSPTNDTQSASPADSQQIQIAPALGPPGVTTRLNLTALTANAWSNISTTKSNSITATPVLVSINPSSYASISYSDFAIIQCDEASGNIQPLDVVDNAISRSARAIILYSNVSNYCRLATGAGVPADYAIYSTTNPTDWEILARGSNQPNNFSPTGTYNTWTIGSKSTLDNLNMSSNGQNSPSYASPGGPSPSTAVAMIILYSITGVITALFLVIIITGAVRAHRHPERYGPRNVLGRPRQSRARGLARAMLETLPIVKFGEKEDDPKAGDVEMATSSTTRAKAVGDDQSTAPGGKGTETTNEGDASATKPGTEHLEGGEIVAAGALVAPSTPDPVTPVEDDNSLGCSICTEDFERGQDVRVLPCKHSFHPACIDPWLLNVSGTCPLCRIDLRPTADRGDGNNHSLDPSSALSAQDDLPPPLDAESAEPFASRRTSRRLSGFWEGLNPRRMQHATPEERIEALRRLREERGNNATEEMETRRRRRLTARLGEHFGVRTRARGTSPGSNLSPQVSSVAAPESSAEAAPSATTPEVGAGDGSAPVTNTERST